ncbi:flagellar basal body P-ring formation chaperone FlgA [Aliidiomarina indica]|uniref:flagellar basal body P-ring formation chaperone FlgA n=1 Tax=Aliidiomarina indica TaxID=2749147 RepID=UPI00188E1272|nr:flagellar basal body P-ring formation chaperone FlgA [Aliidiomarina indica]
MAIRREAKARKGAICMLAVASLWVFWGSLKTALAEENQALVQSVQQFLYEQTQGLADEVMIDVIQPNAHFGTCLQPQPFFPNPAQRPVGRVSVGVRCGDQGQQVRYMQAQITLMGHYVVAAQNILPGTLITLDMLAMGYGELPRNGGEPIQAKEQLLGKLLRRSLREGQMFQPHMVQSAPVIRRGDRVSVTVRGSGFEISREGEAMDEGGVGDSIRIRFSQREIVTGEIVGEARVIIHP